MSNFLEQVSVYSILAPLLVGLAYFRTLDTNSRAVMLLAMLAAIPQMAKAMLGRGEGTPVYNAYALVDGVFWAGVYYRNCRQQALRHAIALLAVVVFAVALFVLLPGGFRGRFRHELVCLNSVFEVLLVLVFFYEKYRADIDGPLSQQPIFWFSMGLLLYAPATYFYFVFHPQVTGSKDPEMAVLGNIHHLLNASMYLIFSIGMYINKWRTAH